MTNSNRLFGNNSTIYMATAKGPIFWLLCIIKLFSYCASLNYSSTANRKIFHEWKSSKYLLTVHRKIVLQLQIAYLERSYDLYGYCPKPNFFATTHLSFCFCASPNYLSTAHRPIISPLQIV